MIKERQLSLGRREEYRGYEIVEVDGLVPYAILSPRGQFIAFRASVEEAKSRIDKEYPESPVQLPESICADGSIAVEKEPSCDTCDSQDCEGCPRAEGPDDLEYGEADRPDEEPNA